MMAKVAYNNFLGHPQITIFAVKCIYAVYLHINKKIHVLQPKELNTSQKFI